MSAHDFELADALKKLIEKKCKNIHPKILTLTCALFLLTGHAKAATESCANSPWHLEAGESLKLPEDHSGTTRWLRIESPGAGLLRAEVHAAAGARAMLGYWGRDCNARDQKRHAVLESTPEQLTLALDRTGTIFLRLAPIEKGLILEHVEIRSHFLPTDATTEPWRKAGEDEDEVEVDADPFVQPGLLVGEDEDEIEVDADPLITPAHKAEDEDEIEVDADPFALPIMPCLTKADDHGDSAPCASPIEAGLAEGEINNPSGEDRDMFRLVLGQSGKAQLWHLDVESIRGIELSGALFDSRERQLARFSADVSEPFELNEALLPGIYYLRIEGRHGAEGEYALRIDASPW